MVADFVDEHMENEIAQGRVAILDPLCEDRQPVEMNPRRLGRRLGHRPVEEVETFIKAGEFEGVFNPEGVERGVVCEIDDVQDDVAAQLPELLRQSGERRSRERVELA